MNIFEDAHFDVKASENFTVTVPDMIYVGISLEASAFVVQAKRCWATPESDDSIEYVFIEEFCAEEDEENIKVLSDVGRFFNFQLKSFSFSGEEVKSDSVFLHCDVRICDLSLGDACDQFEACGDSRRKRRAINDKVGSIRIGPIMIKN